MICLAKAVGTYSCAPLGIPWGGRDATRCERLEANIPGGQPKLAGVALAVGVRRIDCNAIIAYPESHSLGVNHGKHHDP